MWVATQTYIRECSTEGTVHENQGIFFTITNVSTIIANWMAIILFQTKGLRVGLYIVTFLMVVNSFVIQIYLPSTILPNPNETRDIEIKPFLKVRFIYK
jgi:hypothetical protein